MKNILFLFISISSFVFCQETITFYGTVRSAETGETLIGANISIFNSQKTDFITGTASNKYGFFTTTLQKDYYNVQVSYLGYQDFSMQIQFNDTESFENINISLSPASKALNEITVSDKRKDQNIKSTNVGKIELEIKNIETLPVLAGERDILKSIQTLPGIQSGGEGSSGFFVRGGSADQNLILLDEAVVYNASHLAGFFSVFNSDAIKDIDISKGSMPANYGGRLSSVLDISMKDGNAKKLSASGGLGLIASRLTIEGPIKQDTSSFIVSGRRTYIDVLTKPFVDTTSFAGSSYYFYDLTAKANYRINNKNQIFLSGYFGRDVFNFNSEDWGFSVNIPWGNSTASLRWKRILNSQLFMNNSLIFTDYKFSLNGRQELEDNPTSENTLFSGIRDWNLKSDFTYKPENHTIKFGTNYVFHRFNPTSFSGTYDDLEFEEIIYYYAHEYAAYINEEYDFNNRLSINLGLRYSGFTQVGPFDRYVKDDSGVIGQSSTTDTVSYENHEIVQNYGGLEPRLSLKYSLNSSSSLKFAYVRNLQYLHLTSLATSSLPTDVWMPSSDIVRPQIGNQACLGYYKNFNQNTYESSVEVYYKTMENLVEYKEDYIPGIAIGVDNIDNNLTFGDGTSYGLELFLKRDMSKRFNGTIGYTLSKTTRQFDELNNGNWFFAKYDRTHDLSVVLSYSLSERLLISTIFEYKSGNSLTIPESMYIIDGELLTEWGERNSYRMDPYHRMDLALTWKNKDVKKNGDLKKYKSEWVLSIYNLYNRQNPYFIYFETEGRIGGDDPVQIKAQQVSLFPIIPSISWNFNF